MKKRKIFFVLLFLIFVGCGKEIPTAEILVEAEEQNGHDETVAPEPADVSENSRGFYLTDTSEVAVEEFDTLHEFDFLSNVLPGAEYEYTAEIIFWADFPMRDVAFLTLGSDAHGRPVPLESFGEVSEIRLGSAYVITSFIDTGCTQARSGIAFTDENHTRRYISFVGDTRGDPGDPPYWFGEFFLEHVNTARPAEISYFGQAAAFDFLSRYLSLFSLGYEASDGSYMDFDNAVLEERPLVLQRTISQFEYRYYDRYDIPFENAVFASGNMAAYEFSLYDFDYDGIPEIIIYWAEPYGRIISCDMFRFSDGKYKYMETFISNGYADFSFAYDMSGRLVFIGYEADEIYNSFFQLDGDNIFERIEDENIFLEQLLPLDDLRDEIITSLRAEIHAHPPKTQ